MKLSTLFVLLLSVTALAQNPDSYKDLYPDDEGWQSCIDSFMSSWTPGADPNDISYYYTPRARRNTVWEPNMFAIEVGTQQVVPKGADPDLHFVWSNVCQHDKTFNSTNADYSSSKMNTTDTRPSSCKVPGSIIDLEKRTVSEQIPLEGTSFFLNYSSAYNSIINLNRTYTDQFNFHQNRFSNYTYELTGAASATLHAVSYTAVTPFVFSPKFVIPLSSYVSGTYTLKAVINASLEGKFDVGNFCYQEYEYIDEELVITENCSKRTRSIFETSVDSRSETLILYKPEVWGLHGWTLSVHHYFDRATKTLFTGDGEKLQYATFKTLSDATLGTVDVIINKSNENELFIFDSNGRHLETRNVALGYIIHKFAYESSGRLSSIADRFNSTTTFSYSGSNLYKIMSPYGVETTFTISSNRITKVTDPENFEYDMTYDSATGLLFTYEPPTGVVTTFSYNSDGEFLNESKSNGLFQSIAQIIIDGFLNLTNSLNFGVDRRIQIVPTTTGVLTNSVDYNNNLISQVERSYGSNFTQFKYNQDLTTQSFTPDTEWGADRVIVDQRVQVVTESGQNISDTTQYSETRTYTSGNVLKPVNYSNSLTYNFGNAGTVSNAYTKANTTMLSTDLLGNTTTTKYSASGVVTRISAPDKYPVDFEYDTAGRLIKAKKTSTYYETYGYDTYGYLSTINNSKSQLTQFVRNKKGQLLQTILPNSETVTYEYTDGGEVKKITAPNGQVHQFSMSLGDYITQVISPASKTTVYSYDSDKRLDTITKPSGKTLGYGYETNRNVLSEIATSSGTMSISHDIRGRIASATSVDNIQTDITWASDQVQSQTWYDNGTLIATISNTFATDQFKVKEVYLDNFLIADYAYSGGVLSGISNLGISYSHSISTYNHTQNVTGSGISVSYSKLDGSSQSAQVIEGGYYDSLSNYITANMRRNYDNFGQATSLIATNMNNSTGLYDSYYTLTPVYDSNNRLIQVTRVRKKYVSGVLTNSTDFVNKYTYPSNSNNNLSGWRQTSGTTTTVTKQTSGTYNIDDQLTQMTGTVSRTYTYTQDGEVNTMVNASGTTTYVYDSFGYLNKATLPGGTVVEYKMDAFNRRIKKLVNGAVSEYYLWYDQTRLAAILDSSKNPKAIYVYGSESVNTPGFVIKGGVTYKIIHDPGTESVRYVVDTSTGIIAQEIDYDEFGNVTINTDPTFQPLGFAGGLFDSDTKLIKFGARDYDPVIGRWLTKDPIGFSGGDTNLYAYVGGNPMSYIDPLGLWSVGASAFLGIGGGLSFGQNPDGQWFLSLQIGAGLGAGASFNKYGTSSDVGNPNGMNGGPALAIGGYYELGANIGPIHGGVSGNAGQTFLGGPKHLSIPYVNAVEPNASLTTSVGAGAGGSVGVEFCVRP